MRHWYRKLNLLFKIIKTESLPYLFNLVPNNIRRQITRNLNNPPIFRVNHEYFKNTFFPSAVLEWNKLDSFIRNSETFMLFKEHLLEFRRPKANSTFNIHNLMGIKYLTTILEKNYWTSTYKCTRLPHPPFQCCPRFLILLTTLLWGKERNFLLLRYIFSMIV